MNETTPLTLNTIYLWIGSTIVCGGFLVGSLLLKDWAASLISDWRAKKNGTNGKAAIAKNGDFQALINAQNDMKNAIVQALKDNGQTVRDGLADMVKVIAAVKTDTDATRKIVEVTDDDLAHRVHNKPAVEKLIRKIAAKLGIGGAT